VSKGKSTPSYLFISGFTAIIGQDFEYLAVFATSPSWPITMIKFLSEKMKDGRYNLSTVLFFTHPHQWKYSIF
jgi:hypothetical protein